MFSSRSVHAQALLMLLLANFFWGLSFPLIKAIMFAHQQLLTAPNSWFVTACTIAPRFLLGSITLLVLLRKELRTITRLELKQGCLIGLAAGAGMLFQNDGLQFTSASVSAFLTQLYAILIPIYVAARLRRWPTGLVMISSSLVLAGVAILGRFNFQAMRLGRGEIETLISSLFFMIQILLVERKSFAVNRPLPMTLVMFMVQAIFFGGMALATASDKTDLLAPWASAPWLTFTVFLTGFCTLGSYTIMNRWQPKITATEAGLIYCVEPLFASVMALFLPALFSRWAGFDYPNEELTWHLLVGGGLITLANVLLQLNPPQSIDA
ncbi:MAG TPA: EamA family transporter [Lacunisphaera sp.]|jgi:drug/metabolite transporter (DMT)-like permease